MNKKNKLLQRFGIVLLLMLTLCFGFVPDAKAAAAKDATVEASIASTPISKAAPAPYLTTDTLTFDKGSASKTTFLMYGTAKTLTPSASWISVTYGSGIKVTVSANPSSSTRTGKVTVLLTTGKSLTITVKQYGMIRIIDNGNSTTAITMPGVYSLNIPTATVDRKVTAESDAAITVSDSYNWISTKVVGKDIYINLSPNYSTSERRGSISVSNGVSTTSVQIIQQAFIPDPSYYTKDWSNYMGYYDWEQNIKKSSYYSQTKSDYKALINLKITNYSTTEAYVNALKAAAEKLLTSTAKLYGVAKPPVDFFAANDGTLGAYNYSTNRISLNILNTPDRMAETIFHELRHKWQYGQKKQGGSLMQYLFYYNFNHYIQPTSSYSNYQAQVVERDARTIATKMVNLCK